jgi:hypothetical protein
MKSMTRRPISSLASAVLLASAVAMPALANDPDVRATTVPAPICQPATPAQADKVQLSNAAWTFRSGQTGTVDLYCALAINANTVANNTNDNDTASIRIYYRDGDGTSTNGRLQVRLVFRKSDGLYGAGNWWSSNDVGGSTENRIAYHPLSHDLNAAGVYSFLVRMTRTVGTVSVVFGGIDFAHPPVP